MTTSARTLAADAGAVEVTIVLDGGVNVRALVLALVAVAAAPVLTSAPASATDSAVVVQLPSHPRAAPRYVSLLGRTSDGHVLLYREADPTGDFEGSAQPLVVSPGGAASPTDLTQETVVVGDRLVQRPATDTPSAVTSRLLDDDWSSTPIPNGYRYLNFSRDGVLLAQGDQGDPQSLGLLPWSGGAVVPLGDVPTGVSLWPDGVRDTDSSDVLVYATSASAANDLPSVVDTSTGNTWSFASDVTTQCDLAGSVSLHDGVVAWLSRDAASVCSGEIPSTPGAPITVSQRALPTVAQGSTSVHGLRLLPVGDDVLVWRGDQDDTWGSGTDLPLLAVAQDGSSRVLASSAAGVLPASPGHVVAVTGDAPGESGVRDLDTATGTSTSVLDVAPIPAWTAGVAVDGARALGIDDSAYRGALRQQQMDFAHESAGTGSVVDTSVQLPVVAGSGATAWNKLTGARHLDTSGTSTSLNSGGGMVGTDNRWVTYSHGAVLDTSTGVVRQPAFRLAAPVFQDGVTYDLGSVVPSGRPDVVIATDVATGLASALPVPSCPAVTTVQVAGSWMLVQCYQVGGSTTTQLIDRTGAQQPQQIDPTGVLYLGNGFLVERAGSGTLTWRPAVGTSSTPWQQLGTSLPRPGGGQTDAAVAVSQGDVPTVAWTSGRTAYAAQLPVTTSPMPAHPTDVAPPTIANARAAGINQGAVVRWDPAGAAAEMTEYDVSATSSVFGSRSDSRQYPGSAQGAGLGLLTNGAGYTVQITGWNIAGKTTTTLTATPRPAPAAPTDVRAEIDRSTGRVDVTWTYTDTPGAEPVSSFSVAEEFGGPQSLPATARSASFVPPLGDSGPIEVTAKGLEQSQSTSTSAMVFPGPDVTAPVAALGALPATTLTGGTTLRLSATDDRLLTARPLDVRWRSASAGRRLGAWVQPAVWQQLPVRNLAVRLADGQTGCFSVRAHDVAGHVSAWTAPRCTSAPLDDRRFSHSGPVKAISGSRYFHSTALRTTGKKSLFGLARLDTDSSWLVASTCPTCGRLQVRLNGRAVGTVNLRSSATRDRVLIPLLGGTPHSGVLQLKSLDKKKIITLDGLVLQAH